MRRQMAGAGEVGEGGVGVLIHAGFGWMLVGALAEAAVVEGKDVDAEGVQYLELADGIGERSMAIMQEKDGEGGIASGVSGGNPPAGELRLTGFGGVEFDLLVRNVQAGGSCADGSRGMEDELPAALIKEQAERGIRADGSQFDRDCQRAEKPLSADERLLRAQGVLPSGGTGMLWTRFTCRLRLFLLGHGRVFLSLSGDA